MLTWAHAQDAAPTCSALSLQHRVTRSTTLFSSSGRSSRVHKLYQKTFLKPEAEKAVGSNPDNSPLPSAMTLGEG
jgi:hypothetical protein